MSREIKSAKGKFFVSVDAERHARSFYYEDSLGNGPYLIGIYCYLKIQNRYCLVNAVRVNKNEVKGQSLDSLTDKVMLDQLNEFAKTNFNLEEGGSDKKLKPVDSSVIDLFENFRADHHEEIQGLLKSELIAYRDEIGQLITNEDIEDKVTLSAKKMPDNTSIQLIHYESCFVGALVHYKVGEKYYPLLTVRVAADNIETRILLDSSSSDKINGIKNLACNIFLQQEAQSFDSGIAILSCENAQLCAEISAVVQCSAFDRVVSEKVANYYKQRAAVDALIAAEKKAALDADKKAFESALANLTALIAGYRNARPTDLTKAIEFLNKRDASCAKSAKNLNLSKKEKIALEKAIDDANQLRQEYTLLVFSGSASGAKKAKKKAVNELVSLQAEPAKTMSASADDLEILHGEMTSPIQVSEKIEHEAVVVSPQQKKIERDLQNAVDKNKKLQGSLDKKNELVKSHQKQIESLNLKLQRKSQEQSELDKLKAENAQLKSKLALSESQVKDVRADFSKMREKNHALSHQLAEAVRKKNRELEVLGEKLRAMPAMQAPKKSTCNKEVQVGDLAFYSKRINELELAVKTQSNNSVREVAQIQQVIVEKNDLIASLQLQCAELKDKLGNMVSASSSAVPSRQRIRNPYGMMQYNEKPLNNSGFFSGGLYCQMVSDNEDADLFQP